jgi:VanZ family protein
LGAEARSNPQTGQNRPDEPKQSSWLARWWPALLWAALISFFSTGTFTSDNTESVFIPILHWLLPKASHATLLIIHHYIRKSAHFIEYFVFSLLILRAIRGGRHKMRLAWALAAIGIVAGYAALDEFHQSFVPDRTPAISDVLLDTSGGTAAQAIAGLVLLWGHVRERQKKA